LLHPTSLPGPHGIGDFGPEAYCFLDFLSAAGHKLWQVLPLNPTGYADSPFQCFSASAGNPLLINLDALVGKGVLSKFDLNTTPAVPNQTVDYGRVSAFKLPLLKRAAKQFFDSADTSEYQHFEKFCQDNARWLNDFALFMACKEAHAFIAWPRWPSDIAERNPDAIEQRSIRLAPEIQAHKYWQYEFFQQWQKLRAYAHERGIKVIGDVPIYVAHDSADVWSNREFFHLDSQGNPTKVAGVPPDYFSATGQLWGNPVYNWARLKETDYRWWVERFRSALRLYRTDRSLPRI